MALPYISDAMVATVDAANKRAFATFKLLGQTEMITFWRDTNEDAIAQPFGPYEVLVVFAAQEPTTRQGQASRIHASNGELRSDDPNFDVQRDDTFTFSGGATARVAGQSIDQGAYVWAPFELVG